MGRRQDAGARYNACMPIPASLRRRRAAILVPALVFVSILAAGYGVSVLTREPDLPGEQLYGRAIDARSTGTAAAAATPRSVLANGQGTPEPQVLYPAPVDSISIPRIQINSRLIPMNITPDGYMDLPNDPHLVAWYDFTSKPGMGGNAVFSAHVDYINYGPAVFWNLSKLQPGDNVLIRLRDGTQLTYSVVTDQTVPVEQLDMASILAPTSEESITLITCSGEFHAGNYSHRVIIRAIRTAVDAPGAG